MAINGTNNSELIDFMDGVSQGADTIFAWGGNDIIFGWGGNDVIYGGTGADWIDGGAGTDKVSYADSGAGVMVSLWTHEGFGGEAEGDELYNIENLEGSDYGDQLYGDGAANSLSGLAGNDMLKGGGGADTLNGGSGTDTLHGGSGADQLYGGTGLDTATYADSASTVLVDLAAGLGFGGDAQGDTYSLVENVTGSSNNDIISGDDEANVLRGGDGTDVLSGLGYVDTLEGQGGNDHLYGGDHFDTLRGGVGNDVLNGGDHGDVIHGDAGSDTLSYSGSSAGVVINLGGGTAMGGHATGDVYSSVENLLGSSHADSLFGDHLDNVIKGWYGDDFLFGAAGNDVFVYDESGYGDDTILDFTLGSDKIQFQASLFADFEAVMDDAVAFNGGVWLIGPGGSSIQLDNIALADLSASDFLFV
jgi:Ca2+-binding RTX toxin-like protein